jgi:hypothetical protein
LFVFNPVAPMPGGEYEVIAWVNEIGIRRESFPSFLELVIELCQAELEGLVPTTPGAHLASLGR